jgi:hypothetical protein
MKSDNDYRGQAARLYRDNFVDRKTIKEREEQQQCISLGKKIFQPSLYAVSD